MGSRPHHLGPDEAERWARDEVQALLAGDEVLSAELTRLESASPRHAHDWRWLLELQIAVPAAECLDHGPCADWLADLHLLGMRPAVLVAAGDVRLEGH
jgi:hypothetical protein